VVDDFELFRQFVVELLGKKPELQVVGEASDGLRRADLEWLSLGFQGNKTRYRSIFGRREHVRKPGLRPWQISESAKHDTELSESPETADT
jgi:hypothetical protein